MDELSFVLLLGGAAILHLANKRLNEEKKKRKDDLQSGKVKEPPTIYDLIQLWEAQTKAAAQEETADSIEAKPKPAARPESRIATHSTLPESDSQRNEVQAPAEIHIEVEELDDDPAIVSATMKETSLTGGLDADDWRRGVVLASVLDKPRSLDPYEE